MELTHLKKAALRVNISFWQDMICPTSKEWLIFMFLLIFGVCNLLIVSMYSIVL